MLIVVAYDVNTETAAGQKRLRKVAKYCVAHGQRVQNSVFECYLDAAQMATFKNGLRELIDPEKDSIRMYNMGNKYHGKIIHMGIKGSFAPDEPMIL